MENKKYKVVMLSTTDRSISITEYLIQLQEKLDNLSLDAVAHSYLFENLNKEKSIYEAFIDGYKYALSLLPTEKEIIRMSCIHEELKDKYEEDSDFTSGVKWLINKLKNI